MQRGKPPTPLSVEGKSSDSGTISYQWYSNTANDTVGGTKLSGKTASTYSPDTKLVAGSIFYYYCIITNTIADATGNTAVSVPSAVAKITVNTVNTVGSTFLFSYTSHGWTDKGTFTILTEAENGNAGTVAMTVAKTITTAVAKIKVGSSAGDDEPSGVIPPPVMGETVVEGKTDSDGTATVTVGDQIIRDAIRRAQQDAKKNATEQDGLAIAITIKTDKKATSLVVNLSATSVDELIKARTTRFTLKNDFTTVTLDLATLKALAGGKVQLNIKGAAVDTLSKAAQAAIGNRPAFRLGFTSGGKPVINFKGGRVGLQMPYALAGNERSGKLCGVSVDSDGKVTWMEQSSYDVLKNTLMMNTTNLFAFGVGYQQSAPAFIDTTTHWAKDDIEFVSARALFLGTSEIAFSPNLAMTRGMFVTVLGRLAGVDGKEFANEKFADVKADAYYAPYVAWAYENGVANGINDTTFSPDKEITRQEMAVMLGNYSKADGYQLPKLHAKITFADSTSIANWATDAVAQMQMAGILMGKADNGFDATATATRGEVSAALRRFVALVVSTDTIKIDPDES